MRARATTTVSLLRGTSTDEYGDTVDNSTVAASGITASLIEVRRTSSRPADGRPQVNRYYVLRVPNGTPVQVGDRIRDDRTGVIYAQDSATDLDNPTGLVDLRIDLRRAT